MTGCSEKSGSGKSLEGRYANCFQVGYNANEFVVDFGQDHGEGQSIFHSRIILHPGNVEAIVKLLSDSLEAWRRDQLKAE